MSRHVDRDAARRRINGYLVIHSGPSDADRRAAEAVIRAECEHLHVVACDVARWLEETTLANSGHGEACKARCACGGTRLAHG